MPRSSPRSPALPWIDRETLSLLHTLAYRRGCSCASKRITESFREWAEQQEPDAGPAVTGHGEAQTTPVPPPAPLPRAVIDACAIFAGGDSDEEGRNRSVAHRMHREGRTPAAIIAAIRQGAGDGNYIG